jgi:integrase
MVGGAIATGLSALVDPTMTTAAILTKYDRSLIDVCRRRRSERNPAGSISTPRQAVAGEKKVMTRENVATAIRALGFREALIGKLAIFCGMRPGEIFGLKWGQVANDHVAILQRVYRGLVDTPKTKRSVRKIGLPPGSWPISHRGGRFRVTPERTLGFSPRSDRPPHYRETTCRDATSSPSWQQSGSGGRASR